jgi:hypothetical protein
MSDHLPWQAGLAMEPDLAEPVVPAVRSLEAGAHIPVEDLRILVADRHSPAAGPA